MLFAPSAASAADGDRLDRGRPWECKNGGQGPTGYYCLYDHINHNNRPGETNGYVYLGYYCGVYDLPSAFRDRASSWTNNQYDHQATVAVNSWWTRPNYEYLLTLPGSYSAGTQMNSGDTDRADWVANGC